VNDILKRNEGNIDRIARVVLGLVVLSLVFVGPQTMWGLLGLIPLVTGLVGMCPIYRIFGIDSCGKDGCDA
jgi:cadmium resistance protein CadD (predicted permease)